MVCLALKRQAFIEILGPLEKYMAEAKSEKKINARMQELKIGQSPRGKDKHRVPAQVGDARRRTAHSRPELSSDGSVDGLASFLA